MGNVNACVAIIRHLDNHENIKLNAISKINEISKINATENIENHGNSSKTVNKSIFDDHIFQRLLRKICVDLATRYVRTYILWNCYRMFYKFDVIVGKRLL